MSIEYSTLMCGYHNQPLIYRKNQENELLCTVCVEERKIIKEDYNRIEVFSLKNTHIAADIEQIGSFVYQWSSKTYDQVVEEITTTCYDHLVENSTGWLDFMQSLKDSQQEILQIDTEYNTILRESENRENKIFSLKEKITKLKEKVETDCKLINSKIKEAINAKLEEKLVVMFPKFQSNEENKEVKKKANKKVKRKANLITKEEPKETQEIPTKKVKVEAQSVSHSVTPKETGAFENNFIYDASKSKIIIKNFTFKVSDPVNFLQFVYNKVTTLNPKSIKLVSCIFEHNSFIQFFMIIVENRCVEALSFKPVYITNEILTILYEHFVKTNLSMLKFSNCKIELLNSLKAGKLWEIIELNYPQLTLLKFKRCDILDCMCLSLKDALKKNKFLRTLDLSENQISHAGLKDILMPCNSNYLHLKELILRNVDPKLLTKFPLCIDLIKI